MLDIMVAIIRYDDYYYNRDRGAYYGREDPLYYGRDPYYGRDKNWYYQSDRNLDRGYDNRFQFIELHLLKIET
jgi:hypothetical protein